MTTEAFRALVSDVASRVEVPVRELHLRKMKRKWASCSSRGRLTFDPELLEQSEEKVLEAILHELLHIRYPNHGVMFKQMLRQYLEEMKKERGIA